MAVIVCLLAPFIEHRGIWYNGLLSSSLTGASQMILYLLSMHLAHVESGYL